MKIGKVSESVLKRSVLRQLKTENRKVICGAGVGNDCALFAFSENSRVVSCVQEGVLKPGGQWGALGSGTQGGGSENGRTERECPTESLSYVTMSGLIQKCVNNLAVSGAAPVAVMIALILPEAIEEPQIKALMAEADKACGAFGIQIAGGQTRVSGAVKAPIATVTGYGELVENVDSGDRVPGKDATTGKVREKVTASWVQKRNPRPGQDIVLSKWIGLEGTAALAKTYSKELLTRYPAYLVEEAAGFDQYLSIVEEAAAAVKSGVCAMHDASEGGIFTALWEMAERAGVGLTIDLKKLPLRQETVEVCEFCNVNPYELKSGGCLLMTAEDGSGLMMALEAEGIPAVIVGKVTDSKDRILINEDEVRYMDRPRTDEIYKTENV